MAGIDSFLKVDDLSAEGLISILDRADELSAAWKEGRMPKPLEGLRVALWFQGQGFRNRMAFEIGARAMGADLSYVPGELGVQEPIEDIGRYLRNWFDLLVVRCASYRDLIRLAGDFGGPVINARTGFNHPCEILGDLQFIRRKRGSLEGLEVLFFGEVTNLCMGWFEAARVLPIRVTQVGPNPWLADDRLLETMNEGAAGEIRVEPDMEAALAGKVGLIYTDCWPEAGDAQAISDAFLPYQIVPAMLDRMGPKGIFLPCPPVTRGQEVSAEAMFHPLCMDFDAKECLLHAQNAVMEGLAAGKA